MIMSIVGIVAALMIGVGCRMLEIPSPAPPKMQGALLVVTMMAGYLLGGQMLG